MKIANRNTSVNGAPKNANGPGPDALRRLQVVQTPRRRGPPRFVRVRHMFTPQEIPARIERERHENDLAVMEGDDPAFENPAAAAERTPGFRYDQDIVDRHRDQHVVAGAA